MNRSLIKPQSPVLLQQRNKRKRKWNEIDFQDDNDSVSKALFSIRRPAAKRMKMSKTESTENHIKRTQVFNLFTSRNLECKCCPMT